MRQRLDVNVICLITAIVQLRANDNHHHGVVTTSHIHESPPSFPAMSAMELSVGLHVAVTAGRGVIRWIGKDPEFSSGHWVGVELCVLRMMELGDD
jgi:uncharacterized membrane protein (DUF441 family)